MIRSNSQPALTVVVSQGQSRNPVKRALEQGVAEAAAEVPGVAVVVVPHLYDLPAGGESLSRLRAVEGDLLVVSWMYRRAAHWILDRGGVRGRTGDVLLIRDEENEDEADDGEAAGAEEDDKDRVVDLHPRGERSIYCLEFAAAEEVDRFVEEIRRIAAEARMARPMNDTALPSGNGDAAPGADDRATAPADNGSAEPALFGIGGVTKVDEHPGRRWYPVIDFSRCTNCMECIDFCLFGVYGVDDVETILVEQPDNCRKGCPACSRVCPENAIIFPQHKTPAIAGAPVDSGGFKIDLSKLFGAPEAGEDPIQAAARERDEQLLLAGRAAVGMEVGVPKRQTERRRGPKDELDNLLDELDQLDL